MAYAGSDVGGKDECPKSNRKEKEDWKKSTELSRTRNRQDSFSA